MVDSGGKEAENALKITENDQKCIKKVKSEQRACCKAQKRVLVIKNGQWEVLTVENGCEMGVWGLRCVFWAKNS